MRSVIFLIKLLCMYFISALLNNTKDLNKYHHNTLAAKYLGSVTLSFLAAVIDSFNAVVNVKTSSAC